MNAVHLNYADAVASAKARQTACAGAAAVIDLRSPAHIVSAATRKANEQARRRETTRAMRAHLIKVGKLHG